MPDAIPYLPSFLEECIFFGLFAATGGLLAYILRQLNHEKKPQLYRALAEFFSSGFVGILAMLLCKALDLDWRWSGLIVGVFGWMGAETSIATLSKAIRRKLGLEDNATDNHQK